MDHVTHYGESGYIEQRCGSHLRNNRTLILPRVVLSTMVQARGNRRRVKTADNTIEIIEYIGNADAPGVSEIAEHVGLAKSTVHEYLYTLTDRGYLVNQNGKYELGLRLFGHGLLAKQRYDMLPIVEAGLQQLSDEVGEAAWFIVEEHGFAYYLTRVLKENSISTHGRIGRREYLHCLASGKVIMANSPEEKVHDIIERHGLPRKTPKTITDRDELLADLATVRERGYAFNEEEAASQVNAVAGPVFGPDDTVLGGICVSGPARRMERKEYKTEFPDLIHEVADEIKIHLNWD